MATAPQITEPLDEVQHPTLGALKFPRSMPFDERNKIIEEMEGQKGVFSGPPEAPKEPGMLETAREFYKLRPSEQEAVESPLSLKGYGPTAFKARLKIAGRYATDLAAMPGELLKAPTTKAEQFVEGAGGRGAVGVKRAILDPFYNLGKETYEAAKEGRYTDALRTGLLTPLGPVGALANARIEEADPGLRSLSEGVTPNPMGAAHKGLLDIATAEVAPAATRLGVRAGTATRAGLQKAGQVPIAVTEKLGLRVPPAPKALRQAIQPGMNIPRAGESIDIAGPRLKQIADRDGVSFQRLTKEKGENTGKLLDVVRTGKRQVLASIEQRLGPIDEVQADVSGAGEAMRKSTSKRVRRQFPDEAKRIEERAATYDEPMSLRDIEESIIDGNEDLRPIYKQAVPGESGTSAGMKATQAEIAFLRKRLDQKVQELTGSGVAELKREYGALRDVERATARQHAVQTRVKGAGLWEGLAALHAAGDFISGNALGALRGAGTLAVGRRLQLLRNPDYLIQEAFHGKRPFAAAPPIPIVTMPLGAGMPPALPPRSGGPVSPPGMVPIRVGPTVRPALPGGNVRGALPSSTGSEYFPPTLARPLTPVPGFPASLGAAATPIPNRPITLDIPAREVPPPQTSAVLPIRTQPTLKSSIRPSPRSESLATYNSLPEEMRQAVDAQATELPRMPQALREGRERQLASFGGKGTMLKERLARELARDEGLPVLGKGMARKPADIQFEIRILEKQARDLNDKLGNMKASNWPGRQKNVQQQKSISEKIAKLKSQLE